MGGIDGPIRANVDVLVEPLTDSRSLLTISVDFTGRGIGKILVPLMVRREARKEMPDNMAALKQRIAFTPVMARRQADTASEFLPRP